MWIYYWLAANGINPVSDVKTITVPPPQMVANMRVGNMDGFCVGEPWGNRAIHDKIGFTVETTQGIWKDHPEKTLGTTAEFVQKNPNTSRAMIAAILDASKFIDTMSNRKKVAEIIADKSYVNCPVDVIDQRLEGNYDNGIGKVWKDPDYMKFYNEGREFPLPVGRHVVPHPAQALGAPQGRSRLPRRGGEGEPDRALQAGGGDVEVVGAEGSDAHVEADRRRHVGWQEPEGLCRGLQDPGCGDLSETTMTSAALRDHSGQCARAAGDTAVLRSPGPSRPRPSARGRRTTTGALAFARRAAARSGSAARALRGIVCACCRRCSASRSSSASGRSSRRRRRNCRARNVYRSAVQVFANPFYIIGPNDQGIGWNILNSLQRVGIGFGFAALVGIPLGFILGRFASCTRWSRR